MTVADVIELRRELPGGALIEFEERPSGYRAYHFTPGPSQPETSDFPWLAPGRRVRFPSVTTILGEITSSNGLLVFYEEEACAATLTLERGGFLQHVAPEHAAEAVRSADMGGKATAARAAERGRRVHSILEAYATSGEVPNPADYPETDRGYIRGLIRWLLAADPEPVAVERLVAHPELRYAGRLDLRARSRRYGGEFVIDLKTNKRAQIYRKAILQAVAYHAADVRCGAERADGEVIVAVGPDGSFADGIAPPEAFKAWRMGLSYAQLYDGLQVREP